jgi:chlorobactene glucosyltransferase
MSSAAWILSFSTLALVLGIAIIYWLHIQHRMDVVVEPAEWPLDALAPCISAIVPARNEARNIRRCVHALLDQTYPDYEIIVVDDRSTDQTPIILDELIRLNDLNKGPALKVIKGEDLPQGWTGKPHALWQGARHARGEWLFFVDADTFVKPEAMVFTYIEAARQRADLFSCLTAQEMGSFWEKVILPLVFLGLSVGFPARKVNDPHTNDAIASGQFIFINREVYERIGGHRRVRDRIDEDKALAELVKRTGYRLLIADGRKVASTRMYTSLPEMWEGWTKNIFLGLRDRLGLLLFGAALGLIGALALPAWLLGGVIWFAASQSWMAAIIALQALALWVFLLIMRVRASQAFDIHPAYAASTPLGALVFTAMMFASAFKVLSGRGVTWRGRTYR